MHQQRRQVQQQPQMADNQLSINWFKQPSEMRYARRASSSAISNNSTTDIEESTSDHDSFNEGSSSQSPSNHSSRTASPGATLPSGTPAPSRRKGKTGLRLSLKGLRAKSQPQTGHPDGACSTGALALPRSAKDRRLSLDQKAFEDRRPSFENVDSPRRGPPSSTLLSTSAPKPSRFSFIHSPVLTSPSTAHTRSHQRSNTTPTHSPIPYNYGTSPGRSIASPSPLPVKETYTMNKEYDNMGNKMINKYLVVRELGRGVHGKVKLCRDTITNEFCAIKIVDKTTRRRLGRSQLSNEQKIRREIAIMKKCDHPNVVKLIEVIDDPTAKKIYLVLEYMEGGEVRWKDTEDKPILSLQEARSIFRDVVLGLEYLHMQGIYHRDIKPANLLLSAEGGVKISDFGVSHFSEKNALERDLENSPDVTKGFTTPPPPPPIHPLASPVASAFPTKNLPSPNQHPEFTSPYQQRKMSITSQHHCEDLELAKTAGSPAFFAPELCYSSDFPVTLSPIQPSASQATFSLSSSIIRPDPSASTGMLPATTGRPPITKAIDIWALGVTLYCFVYGRCPFIADTEFELFNIIPRKQPVFPDHVPGRGYVNPEIKDLLSRLLEKDVHKRITLKEVKEHPWVTEDLADPMRWRIETDPANYQRVHVTEEEVKGAVTLMDKIKNRIRKLSVSLSNFTNRRRSKSISSTYTPDSPTEHGPIPIIRSPNAAADLWTSSQAAVSPMSLPERFHNSHMYNGAPANICPGRLERPNSICSTTSSIDEVNEGDEHSHSGSGSSAQNNTSYVGRRRLFNPAGQQHQPPYPQHPLQQYPSTTTPYQQQQHQHQHHPQGRYPQRPPSYVEFPAALTNNALATRRTYSDDQLDQALSHRMQTAFYSTSASGRSGSISHSALSKSWVYSPSDQSPLSPALHDVDGGGILQDDPDDRTPTQFTERNIPEDHGSTHHLNDL